MKRALTLAALAILTQLTVRDASAQAVATRTQPADTTIQAGTYDLEITYGGGLLEATLEIAYVRDSITAVLKLGDHESPVKAGARRGSKLTLEPKSAGMDVRYELDFTGTTVKGTFTYQGQAGDVKGKRRVTR